MNKPVNGFFDGYVKVGEFEVRKVLHQLFVGGSFFVLSIRLCGIKLRHRISKNNKDNYPDSSFELERLHDALSNFFDADFVLLRDR